MRVIFAGTPEFAATALADLLATHHEIVAVYTQPDRPAGRGQKLRPSPVKMLAQQQQIPVYQPQTLKDPSVVEELKSHHADIMVVVAYGLILPVNVLEAPRLGCVNIHASLLPRWRGAAPIQRAILAGDRETGITIIQMDKGLDTGAMLYRLPCDISAQDTGSTLHDKLAMLGGQAIVEALARIERGERQGEVQDEAQACYAAKLSKQEAWLDWQESAVALERKVRAFNSWPVARTQWQDQGVQIWQAQVSPHGLEKKGAAPGQILAVSEQGIDVQTGAGCLRLQTMQFPGGKPLAVRDVIKSKTFAVGDMFCLPSEIV